MLTIFGLVPSSLPSRRFCPSARCPNTIYITPTFALDRTRTFSSQFSPPVSPQLVHCPLPPLFLHAALSDDCPQWVRHPAWRHPFISRCLVLPGRSRRQANGAHFVDSSSQPPKLNSWCAAVGHGLAFPFFHSRRTRVFRLHFGMRLPKLSPWNALSASVCLSRPPRSVGIRSPLPD